MVVTALSSPAIFVRLSVDEADALIRHLADPNKTLPRALVAQAFHDELQQAVIEASTKPGR